MTQHFFITSSGTGVGKTFVTKQLTRQLRARGTSVAALKPVISGYDEVDENSDTALLLAAQGGSEIEAISPFRFAAPLSPNLAAAKEGRTVSLEALTTFCLQPRDADVVLVEGVGGLMVPLNNEHTTLDWMTALGWPVILVAGSYLGAISHALTACEMLRAKGLLLQAVVVSESEESTVELADTTETMQQFLPYAKHFVTLSRDENIIEITGILT